MKITVSVIKADVGGIGGHTRPSDNLIQAVRDTVNASADLLIDHYIGYCGDDVHIVMSKQDDLIEQLGAAVLVVGKYLQAYEMEFQEFVVGIQEPSGIVQERAIPAEGAQAAAGGRSWWARPTPRRGSPN